jgi:hypothetical protein
VLDCLHVKWEGSEVQNDKPTPNVHGVAGNPVIDGIGAIALDQSVLGELFEDRVTPVTPATPAFTDDASSTDARTADA